MEEGGPTLAAMRCPACSSEAPPDARFCPACGSPIAEVSAPVAERRVVTILFVDIVGFTTRSDQADPEDVRRTLIPFHRAVQRELEAFGGTLDKFIGDAVMGVFGAPVAHEDDPARAVRAGLAILDSMEVLRGDDPDLSVRVAVNTGEAIVTAGTGPQVGEAVAGDVVNTASRMQSLAPIDTVVIGETTLRAVRDIVEVEALPPAVVKGKAEPLSVWRVLGMRVTPADEAPPSVFVGRTRELSLLHGLFERAVAAPGLQLVTVVGEPGIGKSRVLAELRASLGGRCRWTTGHCLPYGEGVTLAPVAEVLRDLAGIEAASDPEHIWAGLVDLSTAIEDDAEERTWLTSRLGSIFGVRPPAADEAPDPEMAIPPLEIAQAWARVVKLEALRAPVVLEVDDLHWAEPILLRIVDHLADELTMFPVLIVGTARPELLERSDPWEAGRANATTLRLASLEGSEIETLLGSLLLQGVTDDVATLVERAGGNPLYAVEFARMLHDLDADDPDRHAAVPDSVQAVIAARLDAMPFELRTLVQDAAVLGSSCWPGALAAIAGLDRDAALDGIERLTRRGVVRPMPSSVFDGEQEFAFSHGLLGEVAYGRIPRGERATRHLAAARWVENASGDRADERAEVLAHHTAIAVELAVTAGDDATAEEARAPALRWLMIAADRLGRLDAGGALALFERALALAPERSPARADALAGAAVSGRRSGYLQPGEVAERYEAALAIYRSLGDPVGTGRSLTNLGSQLGAMGDTGRSRELLAEAVDVLRVTDAPRDLARAYAYRAEEEMFAGRVDRSLAFSEEALALLPSRGTDDLEVMCLHIRGDARCSSGDPSGIDDLREALRIAEVRGSAAEIIASCDYLAEWTRAMQGPPAAVEIYERGLALAERRGVASQGMWTKAGSLWLFFELGDWNRLLTQADELLAFGADRLDGAVHSVVRSTRSLVCVLRGLRQEADDPEELLALARPLEELHVLSPALITAAELALADGEIDTAVSYLREFADRTSEVASEYRESRLAQVVRACVRAAQLDLASELIDGSKGLTTRDRLQIGAARGFLAEAAGDRAEAAELFRGSAEAWRAFGTPWEEAHALLGIARCADPTADHREIEEASDRAAAIFEALRVNR